MLRKLTSYFGIFVFICFSFYYTDRAVDIIKRNDPIMKSILNKANEFTVEPVNGIINYDEFITGINGKEINVNESYQNMKRINRYDESLLVFKDIFPVNVKDPHKYIVGSNKEKNEIALVFKVENSNNLDKVTDILLKRNIVATFFIDLGVMENNPEKIKSMVKDGYQIENLGLEGRYTKEGLATTNKLLNTLTKRSLKYCYTEYKVKEILDLCSSHNMYTIKPGIVANSNPFARVKRSLESGSIISLNLNDRTIKELPLIISYINQKGFQLVLLEELLSGNLVSEQ